MSLCVQEHDLGTCALRPPKTSTASKHPANEDEERSSFNFSQIDMICNDVSSSLTLSSRKVLSLRPDPQYKTRTMGTRANRYFGDISKRSIKMAFQCLSWISALLCIAHVCSMPTKCQLQRTLITRTHNLLETMTGPFPLQCLDDKVEIRSPTWALLSNNSKQDVSVAKAVYKTLMNVSSLMENDGFPQSWNVDKLEEFQSLVDRQIEENQCILRIKTQQDEDDFPARDAALTEYFEKLETLLKEKEFSVCGWEVVRKELLDILRFILVENSNVWSTV